MKALRRNRQTIYYGLYQSKTELTDEYGNKTGNYKVNYSTPTAIKINVSAARGESDMEMFGINANYTKTLVTNNMNCPLTEGTVLWIDKAPYDSSSNITAYNYIVTEVAKSINSITYAVKKVDTSV